MAAEEEAEAGERGWEREAWRLGRTKSIVRTMSRVVGREPVVSPLHLGNVFSTHSQHRRGTQ